MSFLMTEAIAKTSEPTTVSAQASGISQLVILLGFIIIFYLLLWRPQTKRAKEQRNLLASLAVGDAVMTNGGLLGKINKLQDNFISLEVASRVEVTVQKTSVTAILPKGTFTPS